MQKIVIFIIFLKISEIVTCQMTPWKIVQNRQNLICLMLEWKNISMLKNIGVKDQSKIWKKKIKRQGSVWLLDADFFWIIPCWYQNQARYVTVSSKNSINFILNL